VLEIWCGWVGVVSVLQAEAQLQLLQPATRTQLQTNRTKSPTHNETENKTTNVVIQQHSGKLLMMGKLTF